LLSGPAGFGKTTLLSEWITALAPDPSPSGRGCSDIAGFIKAFTGAGLIHPLPWLRAALIAIGLIYILRALSIPTEFNMALKQGYPLRFVIFSTISLMAGLLYLIWVIKQRVL